MAGPENECDQIVVTKSGQKLKRLAQKYGQSELLFDFRLENS